KKVRMPKNIRMKDGCNAGRFANICGETTEIVEKVRQSRVPGRITVIDFAQRIGIRPLRRKLAQQLHPIPEGVPPSQLGLCFLKQEVVGVVELQVVVETGGGNTRNHVPRQRLRQQDRL